MRLKKRGIIAVMYVYVCVNIEQEIDTYGCRVFMQGH